MSRALLLEWAAREDGVTIPEVAAATGVVRQAVRDMALRMEREGLLRSEPTGPGRRPRVFVRVAR